MYRVIQEALTNIGKYADTSEAKVTVFESETHVEVTIEDEGKGFTRSQDTRGTGLFSMEERARGAGGNLKIQSVPGRGTTLLLTIPIHDS